MKRLCLFRHAKSDWSDPAEDDFHRRLNERGQRTALFMADFIAQSTYLPDAVLCSTATRALQTFAPLKKKLDNHVPIKYRDELYHAMPDIMLEEVHAQAPANASMLLVVAHNPGLVLLAMALAENPEEEIALQVAQGVPTGGLIVFEFDVVKWSDICVGEGQTVFFGRPRDLMAKENHS